MRRLAGNHLKTLRWYYGMGGAEMPSATFFHLPEEKRQRLIDAAWNEMVSVSFDKVSINQIIQNAGVSRGSFYQYFSDKLDLLRFLFTEVHNDLAKSIAAQKGSRGEDKDWLTVCLDGYDWIMERCCDQSVRLSEVIRFAQINPEMDLPLNAGCMQNLQARLFASDRAFSALQEKGVTEKDYIELICMLVGGAVLQSFRKPEERAAVRERLRKQLLILKSGMDALWMKGEA